MVEIWKTINIPEISEGYEVSSIGRMRKSIFEIK